MSTIAGLSVGVAGPVALETGMNKSNVRMPACVNEKLLRSKVDHPQLGEFWLFAHSKFRTKKLKL